MSTIKAYAAEEAKGDLKSFEFDMPALRHDDVLIEVAYCGICHSDLSMLNNDWRMTQYPFVPGHEVSGTIKAKGEGVTHLEIGQKVGVGWVSRSCLTCDQCMSGNHNRCYTSEGIIVGRFGGFADHVVVQAAWATPIPDGLDLKVAGPLFCGGVTVFGPIVQNNISPMDKVAVVGIGGLGHMALGFLNKWGCEVTAFSTTPAKEAEAKAMGAHHFVNSRDTDALKKLRSRYDLILVTINVPLDWDLYIAMLRPKGKLHIVGAVPSVEASFFPIMSGERSIGGSPMGSPYHTARMLEFAARHDLAPVTEHFKMSEVNEAFEHLKAGKARYRIVLEAGK